MKPIYALTLSFALALAAANPAIAQDRDPQATLAEVFAPDRIATILANAAVSAIRTQMELQYDHLQADPLRGTVTISGLVARPLLPYDQARQCEITVERATLSSAATSQFQTTADLNLNLIGGRATLACLEREVALALRTAGYKDVPLDQFKVSASYSYATGATSVDGTVAVNGFGILDLSGSGTILPRLGEFGYPGDPAVRVTRAVATLKDDGGWEAISQVIPENLRDPQTIRELGTEAVSQALSEGGLRPLGAVERDFVSDLMDQVEAFVTDPGEITLQANLPPDGIVVEPEMYEAPQFLIAAIGLQARATPIERSEIIDVATLAKLNEPGALSAVETIDLATAILGGDGVPMGRALLEDALTPLLADRDAAGPAAALLAEATMDAAPAEAYSYALIASAASIPGTVGLMDKLEARMTTQAVLDAQSTFRNEIEALPTLANITSDDPRELRRMGLALFTGEGQRRHYVQAYYFTLLAEAAGDIAATSLREEIEGRFKGRGPEVAATWRAAVADAQQAALNDWISNDLPARYLTN
ncbi:hypothetical protein SAMN04488515_0806 [Cognatiyoonia koreensis]|uniref:DUF2059 domain-containing protein n=1 Tax=Cognatiyoonia koreensis TaxID=364200 RepID=A0A1I0NTU0_9RHOB|nr:hypothetical protein [Cognatiyoonia koreensis]SEW04757.1 hypothetical protein SAMN04488515_0806 [Cognatiyoonia koreensis]